jgi:K+-sensing histidine kinase KdpD
MRQDLWACRCCAAVLALSVRWGVGPDAVAAVLSSAMFAFVFIPRRTFQVAEGR